MAFTGETMISEIVASTSSRDGSIHFWDLRNGALVSSLKGNLSQPQSAAILSSNNSPLDPDVVVSAQCDRATLNCWSVQKAQVMSKSIVPEKLSCLAASHSGKLIVGGGESGRLYVWDVVTGDLLRMFDAHFKRMNVLCFTADDVWLVSASDDAAMHVWDVSVLLDGCESQGKVNSLVGHSLPVTDVVCGVLLHIDTRCVSASLDRTCKIWDLNSGQAIMTILFPRPLTCLALNALESLVYAGTTEGRIFQVHLYHDKQQPRTTSCKKIKQGDVFDAESSLTVFRGHTKTVTCLSLSMDDSLLVSGSEDGECIVWDTLTRQSLRSFKNHKEPVSSVKVILKPSALNSSETKDSKPSVGPFKRYPITSDEIHVPGLIHINPSLSLQQSNCNTVDNSSSALLYNEIVALAGVDDGEGSASKLNQLVHRIQALEKHNQDLQALNDDLFEKIGSKLLR